MNSDGIYWLDATLNGCTRRDSVAINYVIFPDDLLGADQTLCDGETFSFDVSFPNAIYQWQDGAALPTFTVRQEGAYSVQLQVGDCTTQDDVVFTYNPIPVFELGNSDLLCQGDMRTLSLPTEADSYLWVDGSASQNLTVTYPGGLIWGEVTLDGCSFRDTLQLDFQLPPMIDLGPDTLICDEDIYVLDAGVSVEQYTWQDGSIGRTYDVTLPGLYEVTVVDGPCVVTESVEIGTRECIEYKVFTPNAFSPNNDAENDVFQPLIIPGIQVTGYTLTIFDRWGNQVFQTNNPDDGWDGTWNSNEVPMGVYVYFIELDYVDDRRSGSDLITGDVAVVR